MVFTDNYEIFRFLSMAWEVAKKKKRHEQKRYICILQNHSGCCAQKKLEDHIPQKKGRPIMRPQESEVARMKACLSGDIGVVNTQEERNVEGNSE